jgi:HD-GYP domain-containing protein (c-di-GMP phosphodiesterase class II)
MNRHNPVGARSLMPNWEFPDDVDASRQLLDLLERLQNIFEEVQKGEFNLTQFDLFSKDTRQAFETHPWGLFRVFLDQRVFEPSIASSSLHVALLSYLYARSQSWRSPQIDLMVRAALLHDVGMLFLPTSLSSIDGNIAAKDKASFEAHPLVAMELVKKWGESFESTQVALQHHEHWNGGGYPAKLSGSQIHAWAAIVSVCFGFVTEVTNPANRNSLVGHEVVKSLIQDQNLRFKASVVKDFVKSIGLHPPGSILLLSDGSIVRVIAVNETNVMRPRVRILIDKLGVLFRDDGGPLLELSDSSTLFIARPVDLEDLIPDGNVKNQR